MDRTLFTPAMIETYKTCKRAYEYAFVKTRPQAEPKLATQVKRFLLRAFAEVNRGRVSSVQEAQRYIGQQWSQLKLTPDADGGCHTSVQAFRFAYKALTNYTARPYRPAGSEIAGVNLKLRVRVPGSRMYLEDVFDLIIWHPQQKLLEIVDFHLKPMKALDPAWPDSHILVKHFLAARLRSRYDFVRVRYTFGQIQSEKVNFQSIELEESAYLVHWPEILRTIDEMKSPIEFPPQPGEACKCCQFQGPCLTAGTWHTAEESKSTVYRTA